jgi:hypothetical protein
VHAGTHKTATTTVQNLLHLHRAELAASGFFYPAMGPKCRDHNPLAHRLATCTDDDLASVRDALTGRSARAGVRLGGEARLYRAMFLEELGKDYVRTARAKGLSEMIVLYRHVLRNAMIPIITSAGSYLPYVFLGSLVFESFFGLPGLGAYVIEAITKQDFAVVRTMVFLGSLLYVVSYIVIDLAYTWADPRVRLA